MTWPLAAVCIAGMLTLAILAGLAAWWGGVRAQAIVDREEVERLKSEHNDFKKRLRELSNIIQTGRRGGF